MPISKKRKHNNKRKTLDNRARMLANHDLNPEVQFIVDEELSVMSYESLSALRNCNENENNEHLEYLIKELTDVDLTVDRHELIHYLNHKIPTLDNYEVN